MIYYLTGWVRLVKIPNDSDMVKAQNLVLSEAEFEEFRQYCREKGFDLAYFGPDISGSKEEIERYQFDSPKVIKLKKRRFSLSGTPYDVAEWQQQKWLNSLPGLRDEYRGKQLQAKQEMC